MNTRAQPGTRSQTEALKATSIIGGSTAVTMVIRMARTKALALLLGPAGIGLEAVYDSIVTLTKTLFDLGVSSSGVRQIAAAVGTHDEQKIKVTVVTLKRVCLILGLLGAAALFLARKPISELALGSRAHSGDVGLLAAVLLFGAISGGQVALLQGSRRISALARMNILAAMVGAGLSIPFVYWWGRDGVAPYLVGAAAASLLFSWWYSRQVKLSAAVVPLQRTFEESKNLLGLGLVFMASGLMSAGALFVLRIVVTKDFGLDGAGQFQAANAISLVYVNFVLQAMGTDFYPRLTAAADNDALCNQLVNEQAEISLLLALPGVVATIAAAPWVMLVLYSGKFDAAAGILVWQVAGMYLRVNSWPIGFIVLAKGRALTLFWTDLAAYALYVALGWLALRFVGLPGLGIAFLGLYLFHWALIYRVVHRLSGFEWTPAARRISLQGATAVATVLFARLVLPEPWSTVVGGLVTLACSAFCLHAVIRIIGRKNILERLEKFARAIGWRRPAAPLAQPL